MRNLITFLGCILYIVLVSCKKDKQLIEDTDEETSCSQKVWY